jgi:hypothetical protein
MFGAFGLDPLWMTSTVVEACDSRPSWKKDDALGVFVWPLAELPSRVVCGSPTCVVPDGWFPNPRTG